MKMKKILGMALLGGVLLALAPTKASAWEEELNYVSIPSYYLRSNIISHRDMNKPEQELYNQYQIVTPEYLSAIKKVSTDGDITSLEGIQFLKNLESYGEHEGYIGVDPRPLSKNTNLKELNLDSSFYSIDFLKNLKKLETLMLDNRSDKTPYEYNNDKDIPPLLDLTILDDLNNLKDVSINSIGYMNTIVMKKGKTSYTMTNPVILSKQFIENEFDENEDIIGTKESTIQIDSGDKNFTFEDDELKWKNLSPDIKELSFEWRARSYYNNSEKKFEVSGKAIIPIVWK